jgi:hypothetical protein
MKPDIPIIGQRSATNSLLTTSLFRNEILRRDAAVKAWHDRMKISELRKSCGVEDKTSYTVNVRIPPRYTNAR